MADARRPLRILNVVGARPNFMKIAPLMGAYRAAGGIDATLVHTGQHYDETMNRVFFRDLGIPRPDANLGVGSASHAVQTAEIMKAFEPVLEAQQPDRVVVVGDVNSTIACALVAVKLGIPVAHVEAGLRSGDRTMPEEINRILTDAISDQLFCTEQAGVENLAAEGVRSGVHLVGNVMVDTLLAHRRRAAESTVLDELGLAPGSYALLTLHRPSNVDRREVLAGLLDAMDAIGRELPLVAPLHPRLRAALAEHGLAERLAALPRLKTLPPQGYLDFLKLMSEARVVLTDSGGIQEETTILGVPCLTLRHNTERPATVELGHESAGGHEPGADRRRFPRRLGESTDRPVAATLGRPGRRANRGNSRRCALTSAQHGQLPCWGTATRHPRTTISRLA